MSPPSLKLPTLDQLNRPNPHLRVKQLKTWLFNLPKANIQAASAQLVEQIERINHDRYPVYERILLMDTLRPIARQFVLSLKGLCKTADLPLGKKESEAFTLNQRLLASMAMGYKLIFHDLSLLEQPKEHDELELRGAIYIAMQYLSRQIVESFLIYAPSPQGIWQELHTLYEYAETNAIQNLPVDDPYPDFSLPTHYTIDLAYKRILLLTLAEPYHMMQGEADDIYYLVSAWTRDCQIWPVNTDYTDNEYVVDMQQDKPPRYITASRHANEKASRIIDIEEVKKKLDNHLQQLLRTSLELIDHNEPQHLIERRQRDMLIRLSEAWHGDLSRRTERHSTDSNILMACGLNASHHYISFGREFTPELDELKLKENHFEPTLYATAITTAIEKDRFHKNSRYDARPWWQFNASETGTALSCKANCENTHIHVGEIVAYQDEDASPAHWKIGIVRWFKSNLNQGLEMGIMNLSNSAVPVATKALKGSGFGTEYFRALLIPKHVSLQQTRSIVVPSTIYDVHSELAVNMRNRLFYIRLKSLLRATSEFNQFTFDVLEEEPVNDIQIFIA